MDLTNLLMQNPIILIVVSMVVIVTLLKIANKLLKLVSTIVFLSIMFAKLGGLNLINQFIK